MILQANITGYTGNSATVLGFLDVIERKLYIKGVAKMKNERYKEAGFISNVPTDDFDYFFSEQVFGEAFIEFRRFNGSNSLIFDGETRRATPNVEINQIKESGTNYLISPDTTNEQVAVIALCFMAKNVLEAEKVNEMYEDILDSITI